MQNKLIMTPTGLQNLKMMVLKYFVSTDDVLNTIFESLGYLSPGATRRPPLKTCGGSAYSPTMREVNICDFLFKLQRMDRNLRFGSSGFGW